MNSTQSQELISNWSILLQGASSQPDPLKAMDLLLKGCVLHTHALSGRLYSLDLSKFSYFCLCQVGREDEAPKLGVKILEENSVPSSVLEEAIISRKMKYIPQIGNNDKSKYHSEKASSRLLIPIARGEECLGIIDLDSENENNFTKDQRDLSSIIASAFLLLFEKKQTFDLLSSIQHPIDFYQSFDGFLSDLILLISVSSGMPYIVLREFEQDEDTLRCLAQFGFSEDIDMRKLDFFPVSDYPPFEEVIKTKKSKIEPIMRATHLSKMHEIEEIIDVKSFVVTPVNVGDDIFGTLSFGCSCHYDFSPLEVRGFESIANAIGVSITNYRNYHHQSLDIYERLKSGAAITAVEVAQAARHEARGHIDTGKVYLTTMVSLSRNPSRANISRFPNIIEGLEGQFTKIEYSLDKIKAITKPPERIKKKLIINDSWWGAFNSVQARLIMEKIHYNVEGRKIQIEAYPDFLMHAFLNLILNSIEAFVEFGRKQNRHISVRIETPSEASQNVKIYYDDNASGIDPSRIKVPEEYKDDLEDIPLKEIIFKPGVTSKKDGSGFGLYLVRNILNEHKGSINLISHRNGVQFELLLPKIIG